MKLVFDVLVIGGGLVGLSLARALVLEGLSVALVESQAPPVAAADNDWDTRVYAVSPGCATFLESCGAWARVSSDRVARIETMRVFGDDSAACLEFSAYDSGLRELAFVVESRQLQRALWEALSETGAVVHCPANWSDLEFHADHVVARLEDGACLNARLVVGADGGESRVRARAGIAATPANYGQIGVVANFACERPHHGTAYQWFLRDGVLALLPLPGKHVSMVWSIREPRGRELLEWSAVELAAAVESASGGCVGGLRQVSPAAGFPLRLQRVARLMAPRLALVGDAAHSVHPLAGQGVNLGFRDARALAAVLGKRGPERDCGAGDLLRRYERARREDIAAVQLTTDGLQKLFGSDNVSLARARNFGLDLVNRQPLLKRILVQQAVA